MARICRKSPDREKGKWMMKVGVVYPQIELGGDTGITVIFYLTFHGGREAPPSR
jgi:hypothetical protein